MIDGMAQSNEWRFETIKGEGAYWEFIDKGIVTRYGPFKDLVACMADARARGFRRLDVKRSEAPERPKGTVAL